MSSNIKDTISILMENGKYKTVEELMNAELKFDDKKLIEKLNSLEFREKLKNIDLNKINVINTDKTSE